MPQNQHIAIIGAGPVGVLLSIYLVRRGYTVSIFEKRTHTDITTSTGSGRSINLALSDRGFRALTEVNIAGIMEKQAEPMHGRMIHDPGGELLFQPYGEEGQCIHSVARKELNISLIKEARKWGVNIFYGYQCLDIDFDKNEITLQHHKIIHKSFKAIMGVDGTFSSVRYAMKKKGMTEHTETILNYGYKELQIPPSKEDFFLLKKNALHIWPRKSFMLIALPNPKGSFTCTLFLPYKGAHSFDRLHTPKNVSSFFEEFFPDTKPYIPNLIEDFYRNPTSSLINISCYPWMVGNTILIGDAAHGMTPFYGQGMNAGFEDCYILNKLLDRHQDDWSVVLSAFQKQRKPDNDAMAQLALDNFIEMRDLVSDKHFLLRKKIEARLHELFPTRWIPLYSMVTFQQEMRYSEARAKGTIQKQVMDEVMATPHIESCWKSLPYEKIVTRFETLQADQ